MSGLWQYVTGWLSPSGSDAPAKLSEAGHPDVRFISRGNAANKPVTANTALQLSTAWSCIRLLSETIGTLPLSPYKRNPAGRLQLDFDHDLYELIHDSPNADQTALEFWEGMVAGLCLGGNGYAEINRLGKRTTSLAPLPCGHGGVSVYRTRDGERRYRFADRGKREDLPEEKMFHLRGFGVGGDVGLSPIGFARQTMGAALAADEVAAGMFGSGLHLSGFMEQDKDSRVQLTADQITQLVEVWAKFTGSSAAGRIMPLQPGMKFSPLDMDPEDAQLLQTRGFHVEEICRWFRVPPFMVGHTEKSTSWGTGLEQQTIGFLTFSLTPYLRRIEQALKKQLVPAAERRSTSFRFNFEGLLRADSAARGALYSAFGQNGVMTRNEMRDKEDLPPMPGGDVLTVQSNLVPIDQLGAAGGDAAAKARAALRAWLVEEEAKYQLAA